MQITSQLTGKSYKDSDYSYHCDHYHAVTQTYNNWAETHLDGGDKSAFVSRWPPSLEHTIQLSSAVQLSGKAHEDSVHIIVIAAVHVR